MTIQEIKQKKAELEKNIFNLVSTYEKDTEVQVDGIHLQKATSVGYSQYFVMQVRVENSIP